MYESVIAHATWFPIIPLDSLPLLLCILGPLEHPPPPPPPLSHLLSFPASDVYGGTVGQSPAVDALLEKLHNKLRAELAFQEKLLETLVSVPPAVLTHPPPNPLFSPHAHSLPGHPLVLALTLAPAIHTGLLSTSHSAVPQGCIDAILAASSH